jgi:hypothetical protein
MPARPPARDDRLVWCRIKRERTRARERERILILGVVSAPAATATPLSRSDDMRTRGRKLAQTVFIQAMRRAR